jgi:rSAM/selenodomain-associated transferase 2
MISPSVSIVIPVLNEAATIAAQLATLQEFRATGAELLVVDGGSSDATIANARPACDHVLTAPRGRGSQMNAGAEAASGVVLIFLHADTTPPVGAIHAVRQAIAAGAVWGRFDVEISGASRWFPLIAALMNWRSRLSGIATGDQAIFVRRETFFDAGGFPDIPLMEDVALSTTLRRRFRPACLRQKVTTSGRRWEKNGVLKTVWRMWSLRWRYFFGADPQQLALEYGYQARDDQASGNPPRHD